MGRLGGLPTNAGDHATGNIETTHIGPLESISHLNDSSIEHASCTEIVTDVILICSVLMGLTSYFRTELLRSARRSRKHFGFTIAASLSLSLGIGANLAIFSVFNALLFRELPVNKPKELIYFGNQPRSYWFYTRFASEAETLFHSLAATTGSITQEIRITTDPFRANIELVTGSYFSTLGVVPPIGRAILPDDDELGHPNYVAVISDHFWKTYFKADAGAIGKAVSVNGIKYLIIGVAPSSFFGIVVGRRSDIWLPITTHRSIYTAADYLSQRNVNLLNVVARQRSDIGVLALDARVRSIMLDLELERAGVTPNPELIRLIEGDLPNIESLRTGMSWLRRDLAGPLYILLVVVAIGLIAACLNVSILMLSQSDLRNRERAICLALGASPGQLAISILIEMFLLTALGSIGGFVLSQLSIAGLLTLASAINSGSYLSTTFSTTDAWFLVGLTAVAALVSAFVPLLLSRQSATSGSSLLLADKGVGTVNKAFGRSLMGMQIALSFILVAAATVFCNNLYSLLTRNIGFNRQDLLIVDISIPNALQGHELLQLWTRLRTELSGVPGVMGVSYSRNGMYTGRTSDTDVLVDGYQPRRREDMHAHFDQVGPLFFRTIQAGLLLGTDLSEEHILKNKRVAIVSEGFARFFFNAQNPIGQNFHISDGKQQTTFQIVGVIGDITGENLHKQANRSFYLPAWYQPSSNVRFAIRFDSRRLSSANDVRDAIRRVDSTFVVGDIEYADELLNRTLGKDRLLAHLSLAFAILGASVAAVGIFAVFSFNVTNRTAEMGVRIALGAERGDITHLVLREALAVCAIGLIVGSAACVIAVPIAKAILIDMVPLGLSSLVITAVAMCCISTAAAYLPARRAARLDPVRALRYER